MACNVLYCTYTVPVLYLYCTCTVTVLYYRVNSAVCPVVLIFHLYKVRLALSSGGARGSAETLENWGKCAELLSVGQATGGSIK